MPLITFLPDNISVNVPEGTTILDAALENEIDLDHNCGGNCACSTCHIYVEHGLDRLNAVSDDEEELLEEAEDLAENSRLACQCLVMDDLVVRVPGRDPVEPNAFISESETST